MEPLKATQPGVADALRQAIGTARVSTQLADRAANATDLWPRTLVERRAGHPPPHCNVVVWPETTAQVAAVIDVARRFRAPVVPYGGGSGVRGSAGAGKRAISLDMKRLNAVTRVDTVRQTVTVEAGTFGNELEQKLNIAGYTCGHYLASAHLSTVGGWIAAASSGLSSARYGNIEDILLELEVVDGNGQTRLLSRDDVPDLMPLLVGSEGTLAAITKAVLRIFPLPTCRLLRGYRFPSFEAGCEAMRKVVQAGLRPAIFRLYDSLDAFWMQSAGAPTHGVSSDPTFADRLVRRLRGSRRLDKPSDARRALLSRALARAGLLDRLARSMASTGTVLFAGFEGQRSHAELDSLAAHDMLLATEAEDLGEEIAHRWYRQRLGLGFKQSELFQSGAYVDTIDIAASWARLADVHRSARAALSEHALVFSHLTHAYVDGGAIAMTVASHAETMPHRQLWRRAFRAVERAGGLFSHHHGLGRAHAELVIDSLNNRLLRDIKHAFDPDGVLNPGLLKCGAPTRRQPTSSRTEAR